MPYVHITTTKDLDAKEKQTLRRHVLDALALLGKKPQHVMVLLECGKNLTKGETESNCAFCDVRVYGAVDPAARDAFATALSRSVAGIADTAPGCVYLSVSELPCCYTDGCPPPPRPPQA